MPRFNAPLGAQKGAAIGARWIPSGQEGYEGWMSRISAVLPQDPYQRRSASSTHIRDRVHGMVREAST